MYTKVSFIIVCSIFTMSGCLGQKAEHQKIKEYGEKINNETRNKDK